MRWPGDPRKSAIDGRVGVGDSYHVAAGDRAAAGDIAFYDSVYGTFGGQLAATIRAEVFDEDIGQNSWVTADEYRRYFA
jgi:hypothetical protein